MPNGVNRNNGGQPLHGDYSFPEIPHTQPVAVAPPQLPASDSRNRQKSACKGMSRQLTAAYQHAKNQAVLHQTLAQVHNKTAEIHHAQFGYNSKVMCNYQAADRHYDAAAHFRNIITSYKQKNYTDVLHQHKGALHASQAANAYTQAIALPPAQAKVTSSKRMTWKETFHKAGSGIKRVFSAPFRAYTKVYSTAAHRLAFRRQGMLYQASPFLTRFHSRLLTAFAPHFSYHLPRRSTGTRTVGAYSQKSMYTQASSPRLKQTESSLIKRLQALKSDD